MLGVSGRLMLRALADGECDVEKLAGLAHGSLKEKKPELRRALTSRLTLAQRFVLNELLRRLAELEAATARVSEQIVKEVAESADPFISEAVKLLQTIPGIALRVAEVIISEIGVDMTRFPVTLIWRVGPACAQVTTNQPASAAQGRPRMAALT